MAYPKYFIFSEFDPSLLSDKLRYRCCKLLLGKNFITSINRFIFSKFFPRLLLDKFNLICCKLLLGRYFRESLN